jgi:hypothetical protein
MYGVKCCDPGSGFAHQSALFHDTGQNSAQKWKVTIFSVLRVQPSSSYQSQNLQYFHFIALSLGGKKCVVDPQISTLPLPFDTLPIHYLMKVLLLYSTISILSYCSHPTVNYSTMARF